MNNATDIIIKSDVFAASTPPQGDTLPSELDISGLVGPVTFPDIYRRRIAGWVYLVISLGSGLGWLLTSNLGLACAAILLGGTAAYHFVCAWPTKVELSEALVLATREAGFPVGHASAQLGWYGLRSRPSWRVLVYSAQDPPERRGLVEIDAVTGGVRGSYSEQNPEEWADPSASSL